MSEFLILIFLILALPRTTKYQKIIYCVVICIYMCCLVGLRNAYIGQYDTVRGYIPEFFVVDKITYKQIFEQFKDPIYYCFVKLFHIFSDNEYAYIFVFGIPYNVAIAYFIHKYSKNMSLSFLAVMGLSIWKYSFTGMRHVMAEAFLIFAIDALIEHKTKKYFIFTLIGSCFHSSALIFLLVYPLSKLKNNKILLYITIAIAIIARFFRDWILKLMVLLFTKLSLTRYLVYSEWIVKGNGQVFLIYFIIFVFLLLLYGKKAQKYDIENNDENKPLSLKTGDISFKFLDNMYIITLFFNACAMAVNEFARLATFFGFISIITISNYLDLESNKKYKMALILIFEFGFAIIFLYVVAPRSNIIPYFFNWEKYVGKWIWK